MSFKTFFCFLFILFTLLSGSIYDDINLHVAQSYTSSADSSFSMISPLTLSNHVPSLELFSPFYFHFHRPPPFLLSAPSLLITCHLHFNLLSWTQSSKPCNVFSNKFITTRGCGPNSVRIAVGTCECLCIRYRDCSASIRCRVAPMPATAYCSLSRSRPGPWPGHYSSVQFICYFCSSFTCILYYVYLMLLAIWAQ